LLNRKASFVHVPKQIEGLHANIGSSNRALQDTPEILHPVSVDASINIRALGVVCSLSTKQLYQRKFDESGIYCRYLLVVFSAVREGAAL
jgi:hypothetical protein